MPTYKTTTTFKSPYTAHERALRKQASKLAAKANKRLKRLESNDLTTSPAYRTYIASGGEKFGVKGKSFNEVQSELARLRGFLNAESSTVRGAVSQLRRISDTIGLPSKRVKVSELKMQTENFFSIYEKLEEYLRNVEKSATALGSNRIMELVSEYVSEQDINLRDAKVDVDGIIASITQENLYEKKEKEYFDSIIDDFKAMGFRTI